MLRVTTVVIGAGHSGLAVSRHLAERGVDHVVLERGEVASSWRSQRWDSLRLLTPNWMSRLPGYAYRGDDPDGYMSAPQVAAFIEDYAKEIRRAGPGEHDGHRGAPRRRRVRRRDRPGDVAGAHGRRRRGRGDASPPCPTSGDGVPDGDRAPRAGRVDTGPARLPQPRRPPEGGVLVVGPVRQRDPDRPGGARLRAAGHARGRRARADAPHLPGPRRAVVDGRHRPLRRPLRRDPRPAPRPGAALDAAHRLTRARHARPQHARAAPGSGSWDGWRACGTGWRSCPARSPTCARWRTSR